MNTTATTIALLIPIIIIALSIGVIGWQRKLNRNLPPIMKTLSPEDRKAVRQAFRTKTLPVDERLADSVKQVAKNQLALLDRSSRLMTVGFVLIMIGLILQLIGFLVGDHHHRDLHDAIASIVLDALLLIVIPLSRRAQRRRANEMLALYPTAA